MRTRGVDPRDTSWEQDHATYRVSFWDVPAHVAHEFEIVDRVDIEELLRWAREYAAERGWAHTVYAVATDAGERGLIRLAGVLGDPFAP
ncbi:hypothetical protein RM844_00525 [Streptomyces sp. DSM 44915]|uniref:Uncharacterized protein n=1 Tax=Streptomyces chisholmiae TaxID=3075540 RepID=A0ABU2JIF2_9ACTN|nr:hypothetical protein [Streptomyces sp. DSM 44915]MDT0264768.1 hypothetical protein [Streptomyces sp. DSM 44915]